MASVFDGLSGVINATFGSPIDWRQNGGVPVSVQSVFRETPISVATEDGHSVLITAPTWRVPRPAADLVQAGDTISPSFDKFFRVLNKIGSGSPAADAFVVFELEEVTE